MAPETGAKLDSLADAIIELAKALDEISAGVGQGLR
jgi:hypothetical protein